jgi:hypothetical protein
MKVEIRKGGERLTGGWSTQGWRVYVDGVKLQTYEKLADAKGFAMKYAVRWRREVRPIGPRGLGVVVYVGESSGSE